MATEEIVLTPEIAEGFLRLNVSNRPMSKRYMQGLARAMARGEWEFNGDAIRLSSTGKLIDGQHRCAAVVHSGVSIKTLLITDLNESVFSTIDRGRGRTTSDTLSIQAEKNARTLAAIARVFYIYMQSGDPYHGNPDYSPTTKQLVALLEEHPSLRDSAHWAMCSKWHVKFVKASLAGFCHFVFMGKDKESASTFFESLETGAGLDAGSPILLLRTRLMEEHSSKGKMSMKYKAALIFKAFKLYRDGASIKFLRVRTEGETAEKDVFVL